MRQAQPGLGPLPEQPGPGLPVWLRQVLARQREQQGRRMVWLPEQPGRPQPRVSQPLRRSRTDTDS